MLRSGESPTQFEYRKEKERTEVAVVGEIEDDIEDIEEEWKRYNSELSEFTVDHSEAGTSSTEISIKSPEPSKVRPESKYYDSDEDGTVGICGRSQSSYSYSLHKAPQSPRSL
jgi:hypothetical protein